VQAREHRLVEVGVDARAGEGDVLDALGALREPADVQLHELRVGEAAADRLRLGAGEVEEVRYEVLPGVDGDVALVEAGERVEEVDLPAREVAAHEPGEVPAEDADLADRAGDPSLAHLLADERQGGVPDVVRRDHPRGRLEEAPDLGALGRVGHAADHVVVDAVAERADHGLRRARDRGLRQNAQELLLRGVPDRHGRRP
jgi:hypothetical protein